MKIPPWSFSGIKSFEQCGKKFFHLKVAKDYSDPPTDATMYGTEFHEAAEFYIKEDRPLQPYFNYAKSALDMLKQLPGEKYCEYEMGVTESLEPCGFKDENVWYRGIADLIIVDREKGEARVIDYKTGKSAKYADKSQLELMALCIFKHFPEVRKVKGGLLFVVCKAFIKESYTIDDEPKLWKKWIGAHAKLKAAYANNVWNPSPSGLCKKHCVVLECPHNGRN